MGKERLRIDSNGNFLTGYTGIHNLTNLTNLIQSQPLVQEKLEEYDRFYRFLEQNPDVKARYEAHKTYEILKDEQLQQR